jgi:hypothetical protein
MSKLLAPPRAWCGFVTPVGTRMDYYLPLPNTTTASRCTEEHDRLAVKAPRDSALNGKVAAVMGASPGMTGNGARPIAITPGVCIHEHVRAPAAGGPRGTRAREVRRRRSPRAPGDAGFPRDFSPTLCGPDRAVHVVADWLLAGDPHSVGWPTETSNSSLGLVTNSFLRRRIGRRHRR